MRGKMASKDPAVYMMMVPGSCCDSLISLCGRTIVPFMKISSCGPVSKNLISRCRACICTCAVAFMNEQYILQINLTGSADGETPSEAF